MGGFEIQALTEQRPPPEKIPAPTVPFEFGLGFEFAESSVLHGVGCCGQNGEVAEEKTWKEKTAGVRKRVGGSLKGGNPLTPP